LKRQQRDFPARTCANTLYGKIRIVA